MREYKITRGNLGYHVYRKKEENWLMRLEWLQRDSYTLNKSFARTFYHLSDAESALIIAKAKWRNEEIEGTSGDNSESIPEVKVEKQSRSEF